MYCKKTMDVNVSASKFKHISKTYLLEISLDVSTQNDVAIFILLYFHLLYMFMKKVYPLGIVLM